MPVQNIRKPSIGQVSGLPYKSHSRYRGCVGHWIMAEGGGTTVRDISSGEINDAAFDQLDPAVAWIPGQFGKCLDFSGTDNHRLTVTDSPSLSIIAALTISLWIYFDDVNPAENVIFIDKQSDGGNDDSYAMFYNTTPDTIHFATQGANLGTNKTDWVTGRWYFLAATYNDAADTTIIYVDGVQDAINTSYTDTMSDTAGDVTIGGRVGATGTVSHNGRMDEVRIYNRALTTQEVWSLYADPFLEFAPRRVVVGTAAAAGVTVPDQTLAPTVQLMQSGGYIGAVIR